jgi:hypothetical protein
MKIRVKEKENILSILVCLVALSFIVAGCGSGGGGGGSSSGSSGTTAVSINLTMPSSQKTSASTLRSGAVSSNASLSGAVSQSAAAPVVVASCAIRISASDIADIYDVFNVSPGVTLTKTYDVQNGNNRTFRVMAYSGANGSGTLLYEGMTAANLNGGAVALDIAMVLSDIMDALKVLNSGDVVGARDLFRAAVAKHSGDGTVSSDTANFFYAITRVFALWYDMQSDGVNDGLNDSGDILDAFGCDSGGGRDPRNFDIDFDTANDFDDPLYTGVTCPGSPLASGYPSGKALQDFVFYNVRAELKGAISNLDNVSQSFNITWTEPFQNTQVESDYGDVYVLRAAFKAAVGGLAIEDAYDLDVFINEDLDLNTLESFFDRNSNFPDMRYPGNPVIAGAYFNAALDDADAGIDWIQNESDSGIDQENDWINLVGETPQQIQDRKDDIAEAKACLTGQCTADENDTPADTTDDTVINLSGYFDGQITNVNTFVPAFVGDDPAGFFPDPTFGGILIMKDGYDPSVLNDDEDSDGTADSIDRDIYYVYGSDTYPPYDPYSSVCQKDPASCGLVKLGAYQTSDGDSTVTVPNRYYYITGYTDLPTFVSRISQIDAFEFIGTSQYPYCCNYNLWASGFWWQDFMGSPDGYYVVQEDDIDTFIWMESPPGTTGLRVYVP